MLWRNLARIAVVSLVVILAIEAYYGYQLYENRSLRSQDGLAEESTEPDEADTPAAKPEAPEITLIIHRATPETVAANSTYLDSPLTNGNPDAVLSATQNWNPGGEGGTYNDHEIGVWYDSRREKWAVFNQDREPMPVGAAFTVLVSNDS